MQTRLLLSSLTLTLTACIGKGGAPDNDVALQPFESCAAMKDYVADATLDQLVQSRFTNQVEFFTEDTGSAVDDASGPSSVSQTNVQEQGVDEPDLVKTDGEHIFVVDNGTLSIVKSWPVEDTSLIASVDLAGQPISMFLHDDRAVVFSMTYGESWPFTDSMGWEGGQSTHVQIIDVADPTEPRMIRAFDVEGQMAGARMIGDQLYLSAQRHHSIPSELWDTIWEDSWEQDYWGWWYREPTEEDMIRMQDAARQKYRAVVRETYAQMDSEALLINVREDGSTTPVGGCTSVYHAVETTTPDMLSVIHIDLSKGSGGSEIRSTSIMAGGTTMYSSLNHMYLAQSSVNWWDGWTELDRNTRIHRFDLGNDGAQYSASGQVPGWLHNQFSMSEHKGLLRVATTDMDWWWGTSTDGREEGNNVFILDPSQSQMQIIGSVEGLAPGEQIYAARFQGDKGYLVTFRQIDPLFTLDLSDPTDPMAVGELKIPGYSAYLHPKGDDRLIGVGMDGTDDGQLTGVSVSLFDVGDFSSPTEVDRVTVTSESGNSEALWDHHAITIHDKLLTVPYSGYDESEDDGWHYTSGLLVVNVTKNQVTERARIDHKDLVKEVLCGSSEDCPEVYYDGAIRRAIVIDDYLFSISDYGIKVNDLADGEAEVASVLLR